MPIDYTDSAAWGVPKPQRRVSNSRAPTGNKYKDDSIKQEDQIADKITRTTGIGARRNKLSGSVREKPGDIKVDARIREHSHRLLVEAKIVGDLTSRGETLLTVKLEWVDKILKEAFEENAVPMVVVQFRGDPRQFVLLRFEDQLRLLAEHKGMVDELENG